MDEQTPISHTPLSQEPLPESKSKLPLIIGGIILLILVGVGSYFLGRQSVSIKVAEQISPTIIPTETPIADPTANWKTYKINTLGLEYRLPPKLSKYGQQKEEVRVGAEGGKSLYVSLGSLDDRNSGPLPNKAHFAFGAISKDFQEGREYGFLDSRGYEKNLEIPRDLVEETTNSNGMKIYKIKGKNDPDRGTPLRFNPGGGRIGALVNIPNSDIYPGFAVEMNITSELTVRDFDQILSTFKFL